MTFHLTITLNRWQKFLWKLFLFPRREKQISHQRKISPFFISVFRAEYVFALAEFFYNPMTVSLKLKSPVLSFSVAEILINDNKNSTIIVLRSLRLLRIFKLVRPMRHQMMVMIRTMSSVMTFFALLFLFMFTFAILGMHLFGGKFVFDGITSRSNFDSFSWAMATVFQVCKMFPFSIHWLEICSLEKDSSISLSQSLSS